MVEIINNNLYFNRDKHTIKRKRGFKIREKTIIDIPAPWNVQHVFCVISLLVLHPVLLVFPNITFP